MSTVIRVDDPADPLLDDYRGLRDPARRSRVEPDGRFFVAEGVTVIERLLASDLLIRSLLLDESKYTRLRAAVEAVAAPVFVADRTVIESIVGFDLHRGALASASRPPPTSLEAALAGTRLVCALEGINDHENLGAIFRSARALGAGAMVLDPTCADPWYRRSVRVSMGTLFEIPIVRAVHWPSTIDEMRAIGFRVVALTVDPSAIPLGDISVGLPTTVLLGAEGRGLTRGAIEAADVEVTIPIHHDVDSLNVGHAAAIAFHHFRGPARDPRVGHDEACDAAEPAGRTT